MLQLDGAPDPMGARPQALSDEQFVQLRQLLDASSRTFALTIPLLPGGLENSVELAYLLLRAADAIEDATHLPLSDRLQLLERLRDALLLQGEDPDLVADCGLFAQRLAPGGEQAVLMQMGLLVEALQLQTPAAADVIRAHCARVMLRMGHWLTAATHDGELQLRDLGELSDYMYSVAGIVGELLTDLFALHSPASSRLALMARAADFGAGLQLTNIIKDAAEDASQGRQFLPDEWCFVGASDGAERLQALVEIARVRLHTATVYTTLLPPAPQGIRQFCFAPIVLALATLEALASRADEAVAGESIKVDRSAVPQLLHRASIAVSSTEAMVALHDELDRSIDRAWEARRT